MAHADFFAPIDSQSITTRSQWSNAARNFGEGVGRNADGSYGLAVTATTGRVVAVSAGQALVNGLWGDFGGHTLEVPNAHASLDRWDLAVVELDGTVGSETMQTKVISGTPAATPVRPGLVYGSGDVWQIAVAYVLVPAGSANVLASHIGDSRHQIGRALALQRRQRTTDQPISTAITSTVVFPTSAFSRGDLTWSHSAGVITFSRAGVYRVSTGVQWVSNSTGVRFLTLVFDTTGVSKDRRSADGASEGGPPPVLVEAAVNSTVELTAFQNSGGPLNIAGVASTFLQIEAVHLD
ncbi:MAG: hypothetical protein GEU73_07680 [Chloroflexi bacterium]|nr:hypothetical protein [Chloroflexota bacterium]